jgi:hypothetical protein
MIGEEKLHPHAGMSLKMIGIPDTLSRRIANSSPYLTSRALCAFDS